MRIIPKFQDSGVITLFTRLNGNPVAFDAEGNLTDLNTGEKGRLTTPEVVVAPAKQNWFVKALLGAAMADLPAVMTAAGWSKDDNGDYRLKRTDETDKLAGNLFKIGEAAITAPTAAADIKALGHIVRHPVLTAKSIPDIMKSIYWFTTHPNNTKVYHVNRWGDKPFNLREARTASESSVGLHVSPDPHGFEISRIQNKPVMEAYIPKENMETIDIWSNDYHLLSNNQQYRATIEQPYGINSTNSGPYYHPAAGEQPLLMKLLSKYGGKPKKVGGKIYLENDVSIPLRKETWPDISPSAEREAELILKDGEVVLNREKALLLNQRAADLLSKNGKKVIKYHNANASETPTNNVSYMITDPNVFHIPNRSALNVGKDIGKVSKYSIWGIGDN